MIGHTDGKLCKIVKWCDGPDKRVPPKGNLEGHARHARQSGMDNPTLCSGPDKQVPPISEGRARHAR